MRVVRVLWSVVAVVLGGTVPLVFEPLAPQTKAPAANVPIIPHEAAFGFFKNPPGIYTGEHIGSRLT
jgi:hypothetical protein